MSIETTNQPELSASSKHSFRMSRFNVEVGVFTVTWRTLPSWSGKTSSMRPIGHFPLGVLKSATRTKSPTLRFSEGFVHFCLSWSMDKYSLLQRFQNALARHCACLQHFLCLSASQNVPMGEHEFARSRRMLFGESGRKSLGSSLILVIGRSLRIRSVSAMTVRSVSSKLEE